MILENTIKNASVILKNNNISSHQLDAEIILSNIMGVSREFLLTKNDLYLNDEIIKKFNYAIQRRIKNEPVAYIVCQREIWDENFIVNYTTLVPRPETELLIYKTVNFFKNKSIRILDIGTGSGCILLSLLKELKLSKGTGIDISPKAIQMAKTMGPGHTIVTILCDYGHRYQSKVYNPEFLREKDLPVPSWLT